MSLTPQAVGVSWECASAGHGNCRTAGCRCMCHYRPEARPGNGIDRVSVPSERVPTPPNDLDIQSKTPQPTAACTHPSAKEGDKFCRKCGTSLTTAHCPGCGVTLDTGDVYCPSCGSPTSSQITVRRT